MDSNTICPDDSTTCLLRALLNDNTSRLILDTLTESSNEYSWDPVTFGFTVAIGVLAFIVAIVTVFQGCLAAGPGRLKAGTQSIGPWNKFSHSPFIWSQLAIRTTTRTPLIDTHAFEPKSTISSFVSQIPETIINLEKVSDDIRHFPTPVKKQPRRHALRDQFKSWIELQRRGGPKAPYNASWLNLLQQVGLADPECFASTRTWHTDYLGDTLQAAPALGLMKALVFLAVYANDSCLIESPENSSARLYAVRGLTSDLMPQDLETIGPAVIYVPYGSPESLAREAILEKIGKQSVDLMPRHEDLVASFQLFNGKIPFRPMPGHEALLDVLDSANDSDIKDTCRLLRGSLVLEKSSIRGSLGDFFDQHACTMIMALCLGDVIYRPRAFPRQSKELNQAIEQLSRGSMWPVWMPGRFKFNFVNFTQTLADVPDLGQKKEWRLASLKQRRIAPFMKLRSLWLDEPDCTSESEQETAYFAKKMLTVKEQRGSLAWTPKLEVGSIVYALTRTIACKTLDKSRYSKVEGKSIIETIDGNRSATNKYSILLQNEILCVDSWLRRKEEQDPYIGVCALMVLMKLAQLQPDTISEEDKVKLPWTRTPLQNKQISESRLATPDKGKRSRSSSPRGHRKHKRTNDGSFCFVSTENRSKAMKSAFVYAEPYRRIPKNDNADEDSNEDDQDEEKIDKELDSDSEDHPESYKSKTKIDKTGLEGEQLREFWNIVEILRYRALLYAAMLDLCVDSSPFGLGYTDFGVKII